MLRMDAKAEAKQARRERDVKFDQAIDERVNKNVEAYERLDCEIYHLGNQSSALVAKAERCVEDSQSCLSLACELGDVVAIERAVIPLRKNKVPAAQIVTFIEPLAKKRYVKALQVKRDALWWLGAEGKVASKALNLELMKEGRPEAFLFKNKRYPREEIEGLKEVPFMDDHALIRRLGTCQNSVRFNEILFNELPYNPTSCAFVKKQIAELAQWFINYDARLLVEPGMANYPHIREYTVAQKEALERWMQAYKAAFPEFQVCKQFNREEDISITGQFVECLTSKGSVETKAWFSENSAKFATVEQIAHLLSSLPYDEQGDDLRKDLVERLIGLKPEFNQVEGIYNFLVSGGGKFTEEGFAQLSKHQKRKFKIAALKFARLAEYIPPSMR